MSHNLDLAFTCLGDRNLFTEVSRSALDFDFLVEEFLERGEVEDLVGYRLCAVDGVLIDKPVRFLTLPGTRCWKARVGIDLLSWSPCSRISCLVVRRPTVGMLLAYCSLCIIGI